MKFTVTGKEDIWNCSVFQLEDFGNTEAFSRFGPSSALFRSHNFLSTLLFRSSTFVKLLSTVARTLTADRPVTVLCLSVTVTDHYRHFPLRKRVPFPFRSPTEVNSCVFSMSWSPASPLVSIFTGLPSFGVSGPVLSSPSPGPSERKLRRPEGKMAMTHGGRVRVPSPSLSTGSGCGVSRVLS